MRDYITTAFNLVVGLLSADKLVYLALIGLGLLLIWQMVSILTSFHNALARKCRKISKFLSTRGLSAQNYNAFLALVAKMPQEFIRGYKTFEHASYGLPSDYIKRFDSIDVEVNGGVFNHGKSVQKWFIAIWSTLLFVFSLALMGEDATLTPYALAEALILPVLFWILAKILYYIFTAIRQQQYRVAVDEFNEMLDIMNDKIENNDNLPGPDLLVEGYDAGQTASEAEKISANEQAPTPKDDSSKNIGLAEEPLAAAAKPANTAASNKVFTWNLSEDDMQDNSQTEHNGVSSNGTTIFNSEELKNEVVDAQPETSSIKDFDEVDNFLASPEEEPKDNDENQSLKEALDNQPAQQSAPAAAPRFEDFWGKVDESINQRLKARASQQAALKAQKEQQTIREDNQKSAQAERLAAKNFGNNNGQGTENEKETNVTQEDKQAKRGRGRPKKLPEGEVVITSDEQFEEALERAEKLMRKSEEALSASQAKRVEKSLKELMDAMTKYKEEH